MVINNVAESDQDEFADLSVEKIFRASHVNCHSQAVITNSFIRQLIARPARSAIFSLFTTAIAFKSILPLEGSNDH